jgi:hypothetical protein
VMRSEADRPAVVQSRIACVAKAVTAARAVDPDNVRH